MILFQQKPPHLVRWGLHLSPLGKLWICVTEKGAVCRVAFTAALPIRWQGTKLIEDRVATTSLAARLMEADFRPDLYLTGTEFQHKVWKNLLKIKRGTVLTYATLAAQSGNAKAVRAVGTACGANPVAVIVPCHRVIASKGQLGGYAGGLAMKKDLLEREAAPI